MPRPVSPSILGRGLPPWTNPLYKDDPYSVAFTAPTANTLSIKAGTYVTLPSGLVVPFESATAVQMPALTAGTDYAIYACADGSLRADANFSAPTGFTAQTSRQLGGFHYAPGGNAAAQSGGDAVPAINPYSLWDLKWRPASQDPRGMTLVAGSFWADIYLLGIDHHINGTSRNNVTIADGSAPPKVPLAFGGNGSSAYGNLTWWVAAEVMGAYGKQLMTYGDFAAAAYGITEAAQRGSDAVTTGLGTTNIGATNADHKFTSKWGVIQAAGCMWVWGRDFGQKVTGADYAAAIAYGWKNITGGRGQVYAQGSEGLSAAPFGRLLVGRLGLRFARVGLVPRAVELVRPHRGAWAL